MFYAFVSGFFDAGNGINCSGKVNPFQWAAFAKEAAQRAIKLSTTGAVRHWFYDARSSRAPQGHVGLVG
jgi:hypothetical protein